MLIETIFKRLYKPLCLYAMYYLSGNIDEAEDVVQDCFVKMWEVRPDNERAFLYTAFATPASTACAASTRRR